MIEVLASVLPNTIVLTLTGLIIAYIFGVLVGAWLAWKRGSWFEGVTIPTVLTLRAAPEFWLGMVLLAVFSFQLGWFPVRRRQQPGRDLSRANGRASPRAISSGTSCCRPRRWRSICRACRCC